MHYWFLPVRDAVWVKPSRGRSWRGQAGCQLAQNNEVLASWRRRQALTEDSNRRTDLMFC
jgi:hypothetical protein